MPESRPEPDPTGDDTTAAAQPAPAADEEADEPQFVNRAARRAKGAPTGRPQSFAKGQAPVGRGAVQNPRQYGARRSG